MNSKSVAVLTGDTVDSGLVTGEARTLFIDLLEDACLAVADFAGIAVASRFSIIRGDSFQGVLQDPALSFPCALLMRCMVRAKRQVSGFPESLDLRIAVGVGEIEAIDPDNPGKGDGDAFRRSGRLLDELKGNDRRRLVISSPMKAFDRDFGAVFAVVDALVSKWTPEQCEAVARSVVKIPVSETSATLGISRQAFESRLKSASFWAVEVAMEAFRESVHEYC